MRQSRIRYVFQAEIGQLVHAGVDAEIAFCDVEKACICSDFVQKVATREGTGESGGFCPEGGDRGGNPNRRVWGILSRRWRQGREQERLGERIEVLTGYEGVEKVKLKVKLKRLLFTIGTLNSEITIFT